MKKILLSVILISITTIQSFSQSTIILPSSQYDLLKKKGQLKNDVHYQVVNDGKPINSPVPNKDKNSHSLHPKGGSLGCSCLIQGVENDPSFTIAEFTNGLAPEYRNDDGSTTIKTLPFTFCLYGTNYTQFYINNNGNITFDQAYSTFTATGFPSASYVMVAPFWADVDTRTPSVNGPPSGLVYYKMTSTALIVQWKDVGYYAYYTDKVNTFQLIITDGTDPILPAGNNIAFCYGDMQWTTGDASGGLGTGFGGTAATVGVNKGDGVNYFQMGRFDQAGIAYDGSYGNNDGVSWLDNQSIYFNSCASTNFAPIASGLNSCDTIKICGVGDTLIVNGYFLSPEIGQNTNISVNLNGTAGATILSNTPGNTAQALVQIVTSSLNGGNNIITFTATDNGTPIGTTVINVNVFVDTTGLANFNPTIVGNLEYCHGGSVTLSVTPTNYSYIWNNGSTGTSITASSPGIYYVTSTFNGCTKSSVVNVIEDPLPTPVITGPLFTCFNNTTTLQIDSASLYTTYLWSNTNSTSSINVNNGTYTVTVTDTNGCVGTSPSVTVTNQNPAVSIQNNAPFCPGDSIQLHAAPTIPSGANFLWNNSQVTQNIAVNSSGLYYVNVSYANGCTTADSVTVALYDSPVANFTESPLGIGAPNVPVNFQSLATVPNGTITQWVWNFGDTAAVYHTGQNPVHTYAVNGTYNVTLAVQSNNGCWDTIMFQYEIQSDLEYPNVFTPNESGGHPENQYLYFKNLEYFPGTELTVYNRWGIKVYNNKDYQNDWNGGKEHDGTYYYVLTGPRFKEPKYGFVQIIR